MDGTRLESRARRVNAHEVYWAGSAPWSLWITTPSAWVACLDFFDPAVELAQYGRLVHQRFGHTCAELRVGGIAEAGDHLVVRV